MRLGENRQLPLDSTNVGSMLMMVLRRKRMPLCYANLVPTCLAAIYACIGCLGAGFVQEVVCGMIALLQEFHILVLSHFRTFAFLEEVRSKRRNHELAMSGLCRFARFDASKFEDC